MEDIKTQMDLELEKAKEIYQKRRDNIIKKAKLEKKKSEKKALAKLLSYNKSQLNLNKTVINFLDIKDLPFVLGLLMENYTEDQVNKYKEMGEEFIKEIEEQKSVKK